MSTFLLYLFAFCSGFAALIYQVAWSRILSLSFGSSTLAVSAVVAGFMGGMGIGAWFFHRVANRIDNPLRAYAGLEIGIAISTALLTLIYVALPQALAGVAGVLPEGPAMLMFRIGAVFLLLLVPAAIMGGTFPALCRVLLRTRADVDGRLGWIYGLNTLGAAIGALLTGLLLIEWLGAVGVIRLANGINLVIGVASLALASGMGKTGKRAVAADDSLQSDLPHWLTGVVLFGSGFATLGYEIVWFRALHYVLGPGTYTLSVLLTVFLLGLGFGSFLYRPALRFGRPEWNLGFAQLGIALFAVLAMGAEHYILTDPTLSSQYTFFGSAMVTQSWQYHLLTTALLAAGLLLPATIWMGVVFPLASRLFLGSMHDLTSRVGLAYLLSNLGSIVGAILAAVWILPVLGTIDGTRFLVAVNLGLAFLVLSRAGSRNIRLIALASVVFIGGLSTALPERLAFWPGGMEGPELGMYFERESDMGTVQVFSRLNQPKSMAMSIDGVFIAVTEEFDPALFSKQIILAHLPIQLDRNIRSTLNIGVASGGTLAALARYPHIEHLDAVEISRSVTQAALLFPASKVFRDPRTHLFIEDAIHYLLSTNTRYDLIINDAKKQLRFGGNAKILSREFYQYSLDRLSECGMFVQSISLSRQSKSVDVILRTFTSVFPEVEVFMVAPILPLMVGSRCPIGGREPLHADEIRAAGADNQIKKYFIQDFDDLGSLWVSSGRELEASLANVLINDWNSLPLEFISYRQPVGLIETEWAESFLTIFRPRLEDGGKSLFTKSPNYPAMLQVNRAQLKMLQWDFESAEHILESVLAEHPGHIRALRARGTRVSLEQIRSGSGLRLNNAD